MPLGAPVSESAEEQLRAAVARMLQENGIAEGVVTEVAVVCAQQYFDDNGVPHTIVASLWPDAPPHYRRLGLIEYELTRLRSMVDYAEDVVEDDE